MKKCCKNKSRLSNINSFHIMISMFIVLFVTGGLVIALAPSGSATHNILYTDKILSETGNNVIIGDSQTNVKIDSALKLILPTTQGSIMGGGHGSGLDADTVDGKHASELGGNVLETDPQVSSSETNAIPKWNGNTLIDSAITDDGSTINIRGRNVNVPNGLITTFPPQDTNTDNTVATIGYVKSKRRCRLWADTINNFGHLTQLNENIPRYYTIYNLDVPDDCRNDNECSLYLRTIQQLENGQATGITYYAVADYIQFGNSNNDVVIKNYYDDRLKLYFDKNGGHTYTGAIPDLPVVISSKGFGSGVLGCKILVDYDGGYSGVNAESSADKWTMYVASPYLSTNPGYCQLFVC